MTLDPRATVKTVLMAALILTIGSALGAGAARIAESTLASRITADALSLDRLSGLAESAALMEAAVNQTVLLMGTERPAAIARAETDSTAMLFENRLRGVMEDEVLHAAGTQMLEAANATLEDLDSGAPIGEIDMDTPTLEVTYRTFSDLVADRRRIARASISTAADGEGTATVVLTALVVFLVPAALVTVTVYWVKRRIESGFERTLEIPSRQLAVPIGAELEMRSDAIVERSRELVIDNGSFARWNLIAEALVLRSVTRNLVAWDRIEAGRMLVSPDTIELEPIVTRVAEQDCGVPIDVLSHPLRVVADPVRLEQSLANVIAVTRTGGADKIAVVVGTEGPTCTMVVAGSAYVLEPRLVSIVTGDVVALEPSNPAILALSVARHLLGAMGGRITHQHTDDMTLLTLEVPLA